ncbi:MAG: hypothetical protein IJZ35_07030 [Clostridia bacterium]|nr:hypothetical protein [Clostridia bacterium]
MREYTYQDMLRMQEDAANRVREMKKRAAIVVGEENDEKQRSAPQMPDEVKHISYPVELPEAVQEEVHEEKKDNHAGIFDILKNDKDAMLILALLAVLSDGEHQDRLMSLALMYLIL